MLMWGIFNVMKIPDTDPKWDVITSFVAIGLFIIVPFTIGHLLKTRDYLPKSKSTDTKK